MKRLLRSVALVVAALGAIIVVIHQAAPEHVGRFIAVADFANETGDPISMGIEVATALQESQDLRVLSRSRMVDLQRQLGTDVAVRIDESTGREIARRAGSRTLLAGSVRRMGELIVVELRGIDPDRGEYLLSYREQAQGKSEVLALIDRLAVRARKKLVGNRGPSTGATPLAQLVTANLEANRWYETGRSLEEQNLYGAQEAYRKAIALDPEFALAHFALAAAASRERAPVSELGAIATTAIGSPAERPGARHGSSERGTRRSSNAWTTPGRSTGRCSSAIRTTRRSSRWERGWRVRRRRTSPTCSGRCWPTPCTSRPRSGSSGRCAISDAERS